MTKCFVPGPNRKIRCLQPEAIPSIFPGVPSYLSITIPKPRSEKSTRDARAKQEFQRSEEAAKSFLDEDIIVNLEQLNTSSNFPPSWKITSVKNDDNIILEEIIFDEEQKPNFGYSLTVFQTLKFRLVKSNCILPNSRVQHICKNSKMRNKCKRKTKTIGNQQTLCLFRICFVVVLYIFLYFYVFVNLALCGTF